MSNFPLSYGDVVYTPIDAEGQAAFDKMWAQVTGQGPTMVSPEAAASSSPFNGNLKQNAISGEYGNGNNGRKRSLDSAATSSTLSPRLPRIVGWTPEMGNNRPVRPLPAPRATAVSSAGNGHSVQVSSAPTASIPLNAAIASQLPVPLPTIDPLFTQALATPAATAPTGYGPGRKAFNVNVYHALCQAQAFRDNAVNTSALKQDAVLKNKNVRGGKRQRR